MQQWMLLQASVIVIVDFTKLIRLVALMELSGLIKGVRPANRLLLLALNAV